jgi:hypothetical protein
MKRLKIIIFTLYLIITGNIVFAQNLLNLNYWTIGTGSTGSFDKNGYDYENIREWGEGPGGKRVILWKAQPDGLGQADGGWNTNLIPINHNSMYR